MKWNRKDKNITGENITSIHNEKANLLRSLRRVNLSWARLRRPFSRNKQNVPGAIMNGNLQHAQQQNQVNRSLAGTIPGKLHSNLSIAAIAQKQHGSVDQHRTSTSPGCLKDSARQLIISKHQIQIQRVMNRLLVADLALKLSVRKGFQHIVRMGLEYPRSALRRTRTV
ncbi:hypothetical protein BGX38DRAFT_585353 [Terfezia claveryi]|nr:hypothetical protein BGX38DRAFT_585353 [Terfezia claveryi]